MGIDLYLVQRVGFLALFFFIYLPISKGGKNTWKTLGLKGLRLDVNCACQTPLHAQLKAIP